MVMSGNPAPVAAGLAAALALGRLIGGRLFEDSSSDLPSLGVTAVTVALVSLAVVVLQSGRSVSLDPVQLMRTE